MFNYANLNDTEFESLCKDIMERMLGVSLRRFGPGRDHGVDLTDDAAKKNIVVQVKHYQNSTSDQLVRSLKNELPKVTELAPEKYYICCSRKLSVENVKVLYEHFSAYMDSDRHILTLIEIDDFLHQEVNRDILKRHLKLWLDDAGLLEELHANISVPSPVGKATPSDNSETSIDHFLSTLPALTLNPQCAPFAYDYSKLTNILGRSEQIKLLKSFAEDSTQRFLFSVVSGPAGIGKSKLVFCFGRIYQEKDGWIVRRVEPDHLSMLCKQENWESTNNILLIIDYANELKALYALLSKLCTESESPHPNKIRVILISREGTAPSIYNRDQIIFPQWYKKIATSNGAINNHLFGNDFINLSGLSKEDCIELYKYFSLNHLGIHSSESQEKQVAELIEKTVMDEDGSIRPLYALFVMDLYASNPNTKHWNLQYIQEQIYERDRKRWKKELLNQDCDHRRLFSALVNLLLYATIFGKWESDSPLPPPLSQDCDFIFDAVSTSESDDRSKWFKMMTGQEEYKDGTPVLSRLTPDMVGEFFALKTLSQFNRTTLDLWEKLMASSLSKCSKFFIRTIEDYGNNAFFIGVLLKLFEDIVDLIDDNDHVAHQSLCLILEKFYSNYRGNESDAFLLRTRELLNHYIDDHKHDNINVAELDLLFHENRPHMGTTARIMHFTRLEELYSQWPSSSKITSRYISFWGDIVASKIGAHPVGYEDVYVKKLDNLWTWVDLPDLEVKQALVPALIEIVKAANSVMDWNRAAQVEDNFLKVVMKNCPDELILEYINGFEILITDLARQRSKYLVNSKEAKRKDTQTIQAFDQRLDMEISFYKSVIESVTTPSFNFVWTYVSSLTKLTKSLFIYENPSLEASLEDLEPFLRDMFGYMLSKLKDTYRTYLTTQDGSALVWHTSRALDTFCDAKSSSIPYRIKEKCTLNSLD